MFVKMDINAVFQNTATVYEGSKLASRSEVDVFAVPPTDVSTLFSSDYVPHFPLHSVKDNFNEVSFVLTTGTTGYYSLADSFLATTCKIVQSSGANNLPGAEVAPSNLFAHAMWNNLEIYLNSTLVYDSNNMYAFGAYIEKLLTTSQLEKENKLRSELYLSAN